MTIDAGTVAICLATYNGSKYLGQQIDSIVVQTYPNWKLFIRDDGSRDDTVAVAKAYMEKYPEKICVLEDDRTCGSSKKNFAQILSRASNDYQFSYYMFCDQDDVWKEDKIEKCVNRMLAEDASMPILIHTDLTVVDADLNVLGESFFAYRALRANESRLNRLLIQNNVTGCTMFWNKKLNQMINLEDDAVAMHDWWIALVASAFGRIICLEEATILYRQHGNNVVGATRVNTLSFIIKRLRGNSHVRETLKMSVAQANAFLDYYKDSLSDEQKKVISVYSNLYNHGKIRRIWIALKGKYIKQGFVQFIGQMLYI